jgi:CSLREA domain-containing protein
MTRFVKWAIFVAGLWLLAACTPPAADQFFSVDTTADTVDANPGDGLCADAAGDCSLRAAVMEGNANPNTTEINLAPGETYTLTIAGANEDASATGDLDLTERTYIRTPIGSAPATIDANGLDRVIDVRSGDFHFLEGLVITGGNVTGGFPNGQGGGVRMQTGLVGIEDTRITGNASDLNGSGVWAGNPSNGGLLWVEDSTIDNNNGNGGVFARTAVRFETNVTVTNNVGGPANHQVIIEGGDFIARFSTIASDDGNALVLSTPSTTADITDSVVVGNTSCGLFGATGPVASSTIFSDTTCGQGAGNFVEPNTLLDPLANNGGPVPTRMPFNQAPFVDSVPAASCALSYDARQQARPFNGACDPGAVEAQADEAPDRFVVDATFDDVDTNIGDGVCGTFTNLCTLRAAIQEGNASPNRADIVLPVGSSHTLSIAGVDENAAATGDLDITEDTNITVALNGEATVDADGLDRVFHIIGDANASLSNLVVTGGDTAGGVIGVGGGGVNVQTTGSVTIDQTQITGNTSVPSGGGLKHSNGDLVVTRSTIDDNFSANFGGGILVNGDVTLDEVTVTGNSTAGANGAIDAEIAVENGTLDVSYSTIVADGGVALDLFNGSSSFFASAIDGGCVLGGGHTVTSSVNNVWSDDVCDNGSFSFINTPANVAALADNGGPVPTMMPNLGSALLDANGALFPECIANDFDARGEPRPFNGNCDIGAVEAQAGEAV